MKAGEAGKEKSGIRKIGARSQNEKLKPFFFCLLVSRLLTPALSFVVLDAGCEHIVQCGDGEALRRLRQLQIV